MRLVGALDLRRRFFVFAGVACPLLLAFSIGSLEPVVAQSVTGSDPSETDRPGASGVGPARAGVVNPHLPGGTIPLANTGEKTSSGLTGGDESRSDLDTLLASTREKTSSGLAALEHPPGSNGALFSMLVVVLGGLAGLVFLPVYLNRRGGAPPQTTKAGPPSLPDEPVRPSSGASDDQAGLEATLGSSHLPGPACREASDDQAGIKATAASCAECGCVRRPEDNFCRHCGSSLS